MKTGFDFSKVKKAGKAKSLNDLYAKPSGAGGSDEPQPLTKSERQIEENLKNYSDLDSKKRYLRAIYGGEAGTEEQKKIKEMMSTKFPFSKSQYTKEYFEDFLRESKQSQPPVTNSPMEREYAKFINKNGEETFQFGNILSKEDAVLGIGGSLSPIDSNTGRNLWELYDMNTHYHPDLTGGRGITKKAWVKSTQENPSGFDQLKGTGDRNTTQAKDPSKTNFVVGGLGGVSRYNDKLVESDSNYLDPAKLVGDPNLSAQLKVTSPELFFDHGNSPFSNYMNFLYETPNRLPIAPHFGGPADLGSDTQIRSIPTEENDYMYDPQIYGKYLQKNKKNVTKNSDIINRLNKLFFSLNK